MENPQSLRVAAVQLLARDPKEKAADSETLLALFGPNQPLKLQQTAAAGVARLNDKAAAARLFSAWKSHSPALREASIDELLSRTLLVDVLLDQIERRVVAPAEFDAARRNRLLTYPDSSIRDRAGKLFTSHETTADRRELLEKYRPAILAGGDAGRGSAVFKKLCANCHKLDEVGVSVGPDLKALTDRSPEAMLVAVLDPNRAVETKFLNYSALLTDGRVITGMLTSETGGSITLVAQEGKTREITRAEIEKLESSGKSLMPDGIEKDLTPQDLADVISYLNQHGPPRRVFPGNEPQVVKPSVDGSLHLTAAVSEIYGEKIVFEEKYKNLGYWSSLQDHAMWRIDLPKAGEYEVWLDYACDEASAGNRFILQAGDQALAGRVPSTRNWDTYRRLRIGQLKLPSGPQQLSVRPEGTLRGALIDLREIHLVPVTGNR
jgi:putative heme-binding domain-containing protein